MITNSVSFVDAILSGKSNRTELFNIEADESSLLKFGLKVFSGLKESRSSRVKVCLLFESSILEKLENDFIFS